MQDPTQYNELSAESCPYWSRPALLAIIRLLTSFTYFTCIDLSIQPEEEPQTLTKITPSLNYPKYKSKYYHYLQQTMDL